MEHTQSCSKFGEASGRIKGSRLQGRKETCKQQAVRNSARISASSGKGDNGGGRKVAIKKSRIKGSFSLNLRPGLCLHGDCLLLQHLLHHGAGLGLLLPGQVIHHHFALGHMWPHLEHS